MKKIIFIIFGSINVAAAIFLTIFFILINPLTDILYYSLIISYLIIALGVFAIALHYFVSSVYRQKVTDLESRLARWSKLSPRVSQIGDSAFNDFPVGIMVLDDDSNVVKWVNNYISLIFADDVIDKPLNVIDPKLEQLYVNGVRYQTLHIGDEYYDIDYQKEHGVIYFFAATTREKTKQELENVLPALGLCTFDNLDDSVGAFDVSLQSTVRGEYLAALADWVERHNGYFRTLGENRFLIVNNREELRKMCKDHFSILDAVRGISMKNNLRVTLSMGIASWYRNLSELGSLAQSALDLSLRRGGDQVVVNIENEPIVFFGAKSDAVGKDSRVQAKFISVKIRDTIEDFEQVYIQGHRLLDYDAFGAAIGALKFCKTVCEKSYIIMDKDRLDQNTLQIYNILENQKHPIMASIITTSEAVDNQTDNTINIIIDTQSQELLHSPEVLTSEEKTIVIDHHRAGNNPIAAAINYVDPSSSSAVEMMVELLLFTNQEITFDVLEASIMYTGILVDTNNFTFRTAAKTLELVAKLIDFGADALMVKKWLRNDLASIKHLNNMIDNAELFLNQHMITKSDEIEEDKTFLSKVSDQLLEVKEAESAFTIMYVAPNVVGISARSYQKVNVQVIMEQMGGGGHLNSAAVQISNKTVEAVYEELKSILQTYNDAGGENVKIILIEDVKGRGKKGDIIEVANGYAVFLKNSKQAIDASPENLKKLKEASDQKMKEEESHLALMNNMASMINGKSITIGIMVGQDGKVFGSIPTKQIAEAFEKEFDIALDKKKLELSSTINAPGKYSVSVSLDPKVKATFEVNVVANRK